MGHTQVPLPPICLYAPLGACFHISPCTSITVSAAGWCDLSRLRELANIWPWRSTETGPWGALAKRIQISGQVSWGLLWAFSASSGIGSSRSAEHELPDKARAALDCVFYTLLRWLGLEWCKTSAAAVYSRYTVQAGKHTCYNASEKHRVVLHKLEGGEALFTLGCTAGTVWCLAKCSLSWDSGCPWRQTIFQ